MGTAVQTSERRQGALGNLPIQLTRLVGRGADLSELCSAVWSTRLLTLCGPGGVGKTRLAMALATSIRQDFIGGAWWVDLSTTLESRLVAQVVAAALASAEPTSDPAPAAIARALPEATLLAIDNCEQVLDGCAELIIGLLQRSPSLRVIATSRRPLGVPGEHVWRVDGLPVTQPGQPSGAANQPGESEDDATSLFIERATEASGTFDPDTPGTRETIRRICRWLDGMPLAIELAAARVPVLSVSQIADRLERDGGVLRDPRRRAPERHRSLGSMLEWSHRMLSPAEQRLFRRLGVFRGTFSLDAAESVCPGYQLEASEVLDLLSVLIDRSLVQVVPHPTEPRYRLLSTVRQYAAAKLWDCAEGPAVSDRHAHFYMAVVAPANGSRSSDRQAEWIERLEAERDNITEALGWLLAESIDGAARLASMLWPFWYRRGFYQEARMWFEQLLARGGELSRERRLDIQLKAADVAFLQCDYAVASEQLNNALEVVEELGDRRAAAAALQRLGSIAREQGRYQEARQLHERSMALSIAIGDREGIAASQDYLGFVAWLRGELDAAERACTAALAEFTAAGHLHGRTTALINLGAGALYGEKLDLARERLQSALSLARTLVFQEGLAWALHELAITGRRSRQPVHEIVPMLRQSLLIHWQLGDRWRIASVLEEIAGSVLARHEPQLAVEVLAAADALRERLGTPVPPVEARDLEAAKATLARRISISAHASAWSTGRERELDYVIGMVLDTMADLVGDAGDAKRKTAVELTPRESAVLQLLSEGSTNREIAAALHISPSTAGVHVSNILRKLGAKRRVEAAGLAHRLGLLSGARASKDP